MFNIERTWFGITLAVCLACTGVAARADDVTLEGVNAGNVTVDGTESRSGPYGLMLGAVNAVSQGASADLPTSGTGPGGSVLLGIVSGELNVHIAQKVFLVTELSKGGPSFPWASGLLAASFGGEGEQNVYYSEGLSLPAGGDGGNVQITAESGTKISLGQPQADLPALSGSLYLTGVNALSQGGSNSSSYQKEKFITEWSYSNSGNAGSVDVEFAGTISDQGSSFSSTAGPLISQEIGISAISRGGIFVCGPSEAADGPDCSANFKKGGYGTPGLGGDVTVSLLDEASIDLTGGSAIGVLALSANGGVLSSLPGWSYNVDTSGLVAGDVTVDVASGVSITAGSAGSSLSAGIFAVSAGSQPAVPLMYPNTIDRGRPSYNDGGSGVGGDVTVTTAGTIDVTGDMAVGVLALSLSGEAAVELMGVGPGSYYAAKNAPDVQGKAGTVDVTNSGEIHTLGMTAHGIVAGSLGAGGLLLAALASEINAESCAVADVAPGTLPQCNGVQTGLMLGGSTNSGGEKGINAGDVTVTNHGSIVTGNANDDAASNHAMGILAQSVGGGGGVASGSFIFSAGDAGGPGGNGGKVTVGNDGQVSTFGSHATGVVAQSIGGGGGAAAAHHSAPFVSVGGSGGGGGAGGQVFTTVYGAGNIETKGSFSQGVMAQSIGGGGGSGGNTDATGLFFGLSLGGTGGSGGNGGQVQVDLRQNDDVAFDNQTGVILRDALDVISEGDLANGILAQSIGGGGGVGGHAWTESAGVILNFSHSLGGQGGAGGEGGVVSVSSELDIATGGSDAMGILAQSIGGGGGTGGNAYANTATLELPCKPEEDFCVPNFSFTSAHGGQGGSGGNGSTVYVYNGGLLTTSGEGAVAIFAQSLGGGGGSGGDSQAVSRSIPAALKARNEGKTLAINIDTAIGGSGGDGGLAGSVFVQNASEDIQAAGVISTTGDHGTGIVAQSIGGGGGNGGTGDASQYSDSFLQALQAFQESPPEQDKDLKIFAINTTLAVGGSGGKGGSGGEVQVYNGKMGQINVNPSPGSITTTGGNAPGVFAQSIGGGGGNGSEGSVNALGGRVNLNLAVGGSGGTAGDGFSVRVDNPAGATIRTGEIVIERASADEIGQGYSPYTVTTRGSGSVGILAQSIGGGGGKGGNSDASSAIGSDPLSDAGLFVSYADFFHTLKTYDKENDGFTDIFEPSFSLNLSLGGSGGASGNGGSVLVNNAGLVETFGEQAHGIHAQSVGAGGGTGGAVEASSASWQSKAAAIPGLLEITAGVSIGGAGGGAGNGGDVEVFHYATGDIITHGYGANGILAQSIGGGGGYAGNATANSEGFFYVGYSKDGKPGSVGTGAKVSVSSLGSIETYGDDATAILAQSIGGGGGSGVTGCTNTAISFQDGLWNAASPCWGNNSSEDGLSTDDPDWGSYVSLSVHMGGGAADYGEDKGDGGEVDVIVADDITTWGSRSMGVVAQSIGGGGGYYSADATSLLETVLAPQAGLYHTQGKAVNVTLNPGASITTHGDGAWGILAQSIGGSGGFVGDPSLDLDVALFSSNTIQTVCCGEYTTGADGKDVTVHLAGGNSLLTSGRNAHGIVAQSIGGGGGIAAGWGNDPTALLVAGNSKSPEWAGTPYISMTGMGGKITVQVDADSELSTTGEGAIGILAQSSGDKNFTSPIEIYVAGTVIGGWGDNSSGIRLSGGMSANAENVSGYFNTVNVSSGGVLGSTDGINGTAIIADYGDTSVNNAGQITGQIQLGNSASLASFINSGTWYAGAENVANVLNSGNIEISQKVKVDGNLEAHLNGSLQQGQLTFRPPTSDGFWLSFTGSAELAGAILLDVPWLGDGTHTFGLLTADGGIINYGATVVVDSPLVDLYNMFTENSLTVSVARNYAPGTLSDNANASSVGAYFNRNSHLLPEFAASLRSLKTLDEVKRAYEQLSPLGHAKIGQHVAQGASLFSGRLMSCPTGEGAYAVIHEGQCVWAESAVTSADQRDRADESGHQFHSNLFSAGAQVEVTENIKLGAAVGFETGESQTDSGYDSSSETIYGGLSLKYNSGPWLFALATNGSIGNYDDRRQVSFGDVKDLATVDKQISQVSGKLRIAYLHELGGLYVKPSLDLDLSHLTFEEYEEKSAVHDLHVLGSSETLYSLTPILEAGLNVREAEAIFRPYIRGGVVFQGDDDISTTSYFSEAGFDGGVFVTRSTLDSELISLGAGLQILGSEGLDVKLSYDGLYGSTFESHRVALKADIPF